MNWPLATFRLRKWIRRSEYGEMHNLFSATSTGEDLYYTKYKVYRSIRTWGLIYCINLINNRYSLLDKSRILDINLFDFLINIGITWFWLIKSFNTGRFEIHPDDLNFFRNNNKMTKYCTYCMCEYTYVRMYEYVHSTSVRTLVL